MRAAVRRSEHRGAGRPVNLVVAAAPPDMGARLDRAAWAAGLESAIKWAFSALAEALDQVEAGAVPGGVNPARGPDFIIGPDRREDVP